MRSTLLRTATARLRSAKPYPHTAHYRRFVVILLMMLLTTAQTAWAFKTETPVSYTLTYNHLKGIIIKCGDDETDNWPSLNNKWMANKRLDLKNGMTIMPSHAIQVGQSKSETTENTTFTFAAPNNIAITGVQFKYGSENVAATSTSEPGPTFTVTLPANTFFNGFEVTYGYIKGSCGSSATWELSKQNGQYTALTIRGSGDMQDYGRTTVDELWRTDAPWDWQDLKSVSIGNDITAIGDYAFCGCQQLSSITIGTSVTNIGYASINHCDGITEVTLPASVASIEQGAFENSIHLARVNIQKSDGLVTNANAFNGTALQTIVVPTPALAVQYKTATNWSALASKLRVPLGNNLFAATDEGGTAAYAITNDTDLRNLATIVNGGNAVSGKTFRQTANITLTGNFTPIGYNNNSFSGTYDGGGYTISGLNVTGSYTFVGLVGTLQGGTMKNVHLISPKCTSSNLARVGTIVGKTLNARVENCWVINPTVSASDPDSYYGAIIGQSNHKDDVLTNLYVYDNHGYRVIGNYDSQHITRVCRARKVTVGSGLGSVTPAATNMDYGFIYNNEKYYREGLQLTLNSNLSAGTGQHIVYKSNGSALNSNSFTVGSSDLTLTSELVYNPYTVQFNANAGTGTMDSQAFTYGTAQALTANAFTRTGYTFAGWATTANGEVVYTDQHSVTNLTPTNGGTVTLYAKWNTITYNISYDLAGGTVATANPITYNIETATFTLNNPTRTGYTFAGWTGSNGDTPQTEVVITKGNINALHYEAHWTAHTYAVHFNGNGNTGGAMDDQAFTYDQAQKLTANAFTRAYTVTFDYNEATGGNDEATATATATFNGWATTADGEVAYSDQQSVNNLTATNDSTLTFFANWTKNSITLPTPTRTGYTFGGWYSDAELSASIGAAGATYKPSADITLYAKWNIITYDISYDLAGGTVAKANPTTYNIETATFTLTNPTKPGYTFTGWTKGNDNTLLTTVTIEQGSIGNLTYTAHYEVYLHDITIGDLTYRNTSATEAKVTACNSSTTTVAIPTTVTDNGVTYSVSAIEANAFSGCTSLTNIIMQPTTPPALGTGAFNACTALAAIGVPAGTDATYKAAANWSAYEDKILGIDGTCGNGVYWSYNNTSKTLAIFGMGAMQNYEYWDVHRFGYQEITKVVISDGVTSIGNNAFFECTALTSITIPASVTSIGVWAFRDCHALTSITIPASVTSIGGEAISLCRSLASITVAAGNTVYDSRNNCNALIETASNTLIVGSNNTVIPNTVTNISNEAFATNSALTSITIPASVTSIGDNVFNGCESLTAVIMQSATPPTLNQWVFDSCPALTIYVPTGTAAAYKAAENWTSYEERIEEFDGTCGDGVYWLYNSDSKALTIFGTGAMTNGQPWESYRKDINTVLVGNGVTAIGNNAFKGCTALSTVVMQATTPPTLGSGAFIDCNALTGIYVPEDKVDDYKDAWSDYADKIMAIDGTCGKNVYYSYQSNSNTLTIFGTGPMTSYNYVDNSPWYTYIKNITSVTIKSGVTAIGDNAFNWCTGLTSIDIPASVTTIGDYAFGNCSALTSIDIPASVTTIGDYAFGDCVGLTSIDIPASVTTIGNNAFRGCVGLTCIDIPASVTTIGNNAFGDCVGLTAFTVDNGNTAYASEDGVLFNKDKTTLVRCPIGNNRTTYTIPASVTTIGEEAFRGCSGLTEVTIPATVTSIGYCAFYGCRNLKTFIAQPTTPPTLGYDVFGDGNGINIYVAADKVDAYKSAWSAYADKIQAIGGTCGEGVYWSYNSDSKKLNIFGSGAMADYTSGNQPWAAHLAEVTKVVIDRKVTTIGKNAFRGCTNLTTLMSLATTPLTLGSDALTGCTDLAHIYVPISIESTYKTVAGWSDYASLIRGFNDTCGEDVLWAYDNGTLTVFGSGNMANNRNSWLDSGFDITKAVIEEGVTSINQSAFRGCTSVTSIDIPASVTSIGDGTFYKCTSLTSIDIPASVTSIGSEAFALCTSLTSIDIPASVTSIGDGAFYKCTSLTTVTFAENSQFTTINSFTFNGCSALTSITIPASLTSIVGNPFDECTSLESISVAGGNTRYDSRNNCNALIETASNTLILGSKNTVIPNTVTTIGDGAFNGSLVLTSITIPASVNSIAYNAFYGCTGLESISVAGGNTRYDSRNNCNAIIETATNTLIQGCKNTVIPNTVTNIGYWAFNGCSTLTSIDIPASVTSIDQGAFYQCTSLEYISVAGGNTRYDSRNNCNAIIETASNKLIFGSKNTVIPNTVTNIGDGAFYGSTVLTSITIPASVTTIEQGAFDKCTALTTVFMQAMTPPEYSSRIFDNCNALTVIYVPTGTAATYKADSYLSKYKDIIKEMSEITEIALADNASNSNLIVGVHGLTLDVTLQGRTLYKDGDWNTLCLPFALDKDRVKELLEEPAELKTLGKTSFEDGALTLTFEDAAEIMPGRPYLIRWEKAKDYVDDALHNLVNPVFTGVTISNDIKPTETDYADFIGITSPVNFAANDRSVLFLGSQNKLYYPDQAMTLRACRGYFQLNGITAGDVASTRLNFSDDTNEVNEVSEVNNVNDDSWYTLDGRKITGKPTTKGFYINGNKKVYVK